MRVLVTGGNGFVGRHLVAELRERGHAVVSAGRGELAEHEMALDLGDVDGIRTLVERARPEIVYHLAALASVAEAVRDPLETYRVNVEGTANVVEALRELSGVRLVFASSAEVYGVKTLADMPLRESTLPSPATIYAASKLAAEAIVMASARTYAMRVIVVRSFNLIGRGKARVSSSARSRIGLRLSRPAVPALFPVGNLTAQRDFLDVRDAAKAFADLGERGIDGEIYNVCGGKPTAISDVLRQLVFAARVGVEIREDPALMRPVDVPIAYGDNTKLYEATGWKPSIPLVKTLRDAYAAAQAAREVIPGSDANAAAHGL